MRTITRRQEARGSGWRADEDYEVVLVGRGTVHLEYLKLSNDTQLHQLIKTVACAAVMSAPVA